MNRDVAVQALDVRAHNVHANAAPGDIGDDLRRREAGHEDPLDRLVFGGRFGGFARHETLFDHLVAQRARIDALAVVFDGEVDVGFLVPGGDRDGARLRLAGRAPFFRRFDAVVDSVAQDVDERVARFPR